MRQRVAFGQRKKTHTVIIASGERIRHFTIRPWLAALVGSALAAIAIGYLLATTYLVLRDDLIGAAIAHQARMQQAYEDRIAELRAQLDRVTSRQLLDQQIMEAKVAELLARQKELSLRHGRLDVVSGQESRMMPEEVPAPEPRPDRRAMLEIRTGLDLAGRSARIDQESSREVAAASASRLLAAFSGHGFLRSGQLSVADRADRIFVAINRSLRTIESEQLDRVRQLTADTYQTAEEIAETLRSAGLEIDADYGGAGTGGPFVSSEAATSFDDEVAELDAALARLDAVKALARRLPIANPAAGRAISSRFGMRRDPILGVPAMHAGMDFRAPAGTPVAAAAPGIVVFADWNGGYGRMIEIDHGNGFSTRYAHLRRILVKEGQEVQSGTRIGEVGNSGRSTGPHLHYEVRREGRAVNPITFLAIGRKLTRLL
jgi:murein DD-endopeptidase MepM/ murein hydrolase activator NlpD